MTEHVEEAAELIGQLAPRHAKVSIRIPLEEDEAMIIPAPEGPESGDEPQRSRRTRRNGRPQKLTPELIDAIALLIRNGAYDYVAAQAVGITYQTFYNWMRRGSAAKSGLHAEFFASITQSRAIARADAENRVYQTNPATWLKHVARDRPEQPGWSDNPLPEKGGGEAKAAVIELVDRIRKGEING